MEKIIIKKGSEIKEYYNNRSLSTQDIDNVENKIEYFMSSRITRHNRDLLEYLFKNIQEAKTKKDFSNIKNNFIKFYFESDPNPENIIKYRELLKDQKALPVSIAIKEIIQKHIYNKLNKIDRGTDYINIAKIEDAKFEGTEISKLFEMAGIEYKRNTKIPELQTLIEKSFLDIVDIVFYKKVTNRCFDCKYGHPDTCIKIEDMPKKHISEYPFIEIGQQLVNNGEIEKFIITKCKKYKKEPNPSPYRRTYDNI